MELLRYLSVVRSRWLLILLTVISATAGGYILGNTDTTYTATATLYVGQRSIETEPGQNQLTQDRIRAFDLAAYTFSVMVDSEVIAERALRETPVDLNPAQVVEMTEATPLVGTQLLYIDVTDTDPALAQSVANGLADTFIDAVQEFEPADDEGAVPRLPAYIFERAKLPTEPNATPLVRIVLLAMLFGLILGIGVALLLDYLDLTVRGPDDIERRLDLPVLGVIPSLGRTLPTEPLVSGSPRARPPASVASAASRSQTASAPVGAPEARTSEARNG